MRKKNPAPIGAASLADLILAAAGLIEQAANQGARRGYAQAIAVLEGVIAGAAQYDEYEADALRRALAILKAEAPR